MTRWLRTTMWNMALEPITAVACEDDMTTPVAEAIEMLRFASDVFVKTDLFTLDTDSVVTATLEANRRMERNLPRERNQAILYYWTRQQFATLRPGGVLSNTKRSPLTADEIRDAHEQLTALPIFRDYTLLSFAEDGTEVLTQKEPT